MNENEEKIQIVKNFIFNDDISKSINNINQNFLDLNILDITGMGTQEIKHSSILAWLLGDNEHKLGYQVFTEFLKSIYSENSRSNDNFEDELDELQSYIYLAHKDELKIYKEKDHIDLLIKDKNNKKIFVIENKVLAGERINGEDGGQLKKYEKTVEEKYSGYKKYYIFLTPGLEDASQPKWLNASYQMIVDVIKNLDSKELSEKAKFVLDSYVDLLKRRNIVEDYKVLELANKIWENPEYKKALDILYEYKPDTTLHIKKYIDKKLESIDNIKLEASSKSYIRFADLRWDILVNQKSGNKKWNRNIERVLLYEFNNLSYRLSLDLIIGPGDENYRNKFFIFVKEKDFRKKVKDLGIKSIMKAGQFNKLSNHQRMIKIEIINYDDLESKSVDDIEKQIDDFFEKFFPTKYDELSTLILECCSNNTNFS